MVKEHTLHAFNPFKYSKTCFMLQHTVCHTTLIAYASKPHKKPYDGQATQNEWQKNEHKTELTDF